ncbi:MAG TPA: RDD family protein [Steroidobacteraceae bacterium]|nr:RDD family protein [Steroidobacteraceae bacterium]
MTPQPLEPSHAESELQYVGFWLRFCAFLIDSLLVLVIALPILRFFGYGYARMLDLPGGDANYGHDFILEVLAAIAIIAFWLARQATPGKMVISAKIVDARTGAKPSVGQAIARYLGYYVSVIPLCLGLLWVGLDPRKQGWHDKIAGTVVVRPKRRPGVEPVRFTASG